MYIHIHNDKYGPKQCRYMYIHVYTCVHVQYVHMHMCMCMYMYVSTMYLMHAYSFNVRYIHTLILYTKDVLHCIGTFTCTCTYVYKNSLYSEKCMQ